MAEAYIVDAIRTAVGKRRGALSKAHPADVGGFILSELVRRNSIPAEDYNDVIYGATDAVRPMAGNVAWRAQPSHERAGR